LAYSYERPDHRALADLEHLVHQASEELAAWRRRTLRAEAELVRGIAHRLAFLEQEREEGAA
jgi:hypothetical protein